jgi:DNA-binding response OmpR family regulator
MAKILIFEPETRYRVLLRYILEGINHRVLDAGSGEDIPVLLASDTPDLVILGVHLDTEPGLLSWQEWQLALPDVPTLLLFSGEAHRREGFLDAWDGPKTLNMMVQPVEPYPLLAMVKSMLTAPEVWRRGGQHIV